MGIKERKERERDERRELILKAASEIITCEGLDNLSVRKIATKIEYSPAIIYHYFKDKDDIVTNVMRRGYKKIIDAISSAKVTTEDPAQKLREMTRNYITAALQMPDEFKAVQLNTSPGLLEFTSSLFPGAADKKPALGILFQNLKELYQEIEVADQVLELTAQIIAAATFGIIIRLILEKDIISDQQREALIDHYVKCVIDGMILGEPIYN